MAVDMDDLAKLVEKIQTMDDFLDFLKKLIEYQSRTNYGDWKNYELDSYLRGIGTSLTDQLGDQEPSWHLFGKILLNAAIVDAEFGD
jgi:hypothetical protein